MEIGRRIREERMRRNIKQFELAEQAGISNSFLSDIETGRTTPSIKTLKKLSKALGVNCTIFLGIDEEEEHKEREEDNGKN